MMGTERSKTTTNLERSKEMYKILAEAIESEPEKELAMGELFEYAEELGGDELRRLTETIGGKALMRSEATEFKDTPPSEQQKAQIQDEIVPEDIGIVPHSRIYAYSYKMGKRNDRKGHKKDSGDDEEGTLSSVYTMYIDETSKVPICACPQIARGGPICHHMMLHAVQYGFGDDIGQDSSPG
jgi:hypothetical protein